MSLCKLRYSLVGLLLLLALADAIRPAVRGQQATTPARGDETAKVDLYGDPLPPRALVRLGTVRYRHGSLGATFLADNKTVIGATQNNAIHLWEARTGRLVRTIDTGRLSISQHCVLSHDRKRIAVSGSVRMGDDWRAAIGVYDVASGKELRVFEREPREGVHAIALTPDGNLLLSLGRSGALQIEEVATGVELLRQQFPGDVVAYLAISADGSTLALGSGPNTHKLYLWKWQSGDEPREMQAPRYAGRGLAFSPDGKLLAESSETEPTIRLWDVDRGKIVHRLELPDHEHYWHNYLAFSPDGRTVAAAGSRNDGGAVHFWDAKTGKFQQRLDLGTGHLSYSPDGRLLVSGRRVWDFAAGTNLSVNDQAHTASVARIVAADKDLVVTCDEYTVRCWDAATGKQRLNLPFDRWVRDIALSPDGTRLVSTSLDDTVCLWDLAAGRKIYRLPGHGKMGGRRAVAFTSDGKHFLSWGDDMNLRKWEVRNGKAVFEHAIRPTGIRVPNEDDEVHEKEMFGFHFGHGILSRDGKHFVLEAGRQFFVFDATTGKELRTVAVDGSHVISTEISPDGKLLLASAWGKQIQTKLPDGSTRYSTADQHLVSLCDMTTGKTLKQLILPEQEAGPIAFSPDGKLFAEAVGKAGGRIRLWSVAAEGEVGSIDIGRGTVRSLAFMPDGKRLISGMHDSTAIIWDLNVKR